MNDNYIKFKFNFYIYFMNPTVIIYIQSVYIKFTLLLKQKDIIPNYKSQDVVHRNYVETMHYLTETFLFFVFNFINLK